jgi:hypothetical protein
MKGLIEDEKLQEENSKRINFITKNVMLTL